MRAPGRLAAALGLWIAAAAGVQAQAPERARALFEEGMTHAAQERWVPALEAFRRSLELAEVPVTLFNIGSVLMRLGRMQEAVATFERYLERTDDPRERAEAQALIEQARGAIRRLRVTVDPPDARLSVDGTDLPGRGAERVVPVDPGTHRLTARASGFDRAEYVVEPDTRTLAVRLSPQPATVVVRASEARASILIDGVAQGRGEVRLELEPGRHRVRVDGGDEFAPFVRTVDLEPGERMNIEAALSRRDPLVRRAWFWGVLSATAVAVAGGVTAAVLLTGREKAPYGGTTGFVF